MARTLLRSDGQAILLLDPASFKMYGGSGGRGRREKANAAVLKSNGGMSLSNVRSDLGGQYGWEEEEGYEQDVNSLFRVIYSGNGLTWPGVEQGSFGLASSSASSRDSFSLVQTALATHKVSRY